MSTSTRKHSSLICEFILATPVLALSAERSSGWDAIFMYDIAEDGKADLLSINLSPSTGDGPRNSYPTTDGKLLYVVCTHSSQKTAIKLTQYTR